MNPGDLIAVAILTFSGVAIGGAVSLVFLPGSQAVRGSDRLEQVALDSARLGFAIMVGLIAELVARVGTVDVTMWRTWVYLIGAIMAGLGYAILAIRGVRRMFKKEDP